MTTAEILVMSDQQVADALLNEWFQPGVETLNLGPLGGLMPLKGGPERYGNICLLTSEMLPDRNQAMKADMLLGAVYGFRNGSGLWDDTKIRQHLDHVSELVDPLAADVRLPLKRRRLYHLGLIEREVWSRDHFRKAAKLHEEAAGIATTDAKRQMELACAAVEMLHHAVETGDTYLFDQQMAAFYQVEDGLRPFAVEDAEAKKWLEADIPCHRLYCAWLMAQNYAKAEQDFAAVNRFSDPENGCVNTFV